MGESKKALKDKSNPHSLVQGAKRRAMVTSYLQAHGAKTIAELVQHFGWGSSGVAYTATKMVESGLIGVRKEGLKNVYFANGSVGEVAVVNGNTDLFDPEAPQPVPLQPLRRQRASKSTDVELVVGGMQVVLGRNPNTGRLRITLEEL